MCLMLLMCDECILSSPAPVLLRLLITSTTSHGAHALRKNDCG